MPEGLVAWKSLVEEAETRLSGSLGGDRRQEARWLVERVSGYGAAELIANEGEFVPTRSMAFFDGLLERRAAGEPLQYVLGRWPFREIELVVDRRALIPRPETEWVAQPAIDHLQQLAKTRRAQGQNDEVRAVDLGCGSGAVVCSIAHEVPSALVWGSDVSADALALTAVNVAGLGRAGSRARLVSGSWFEPLDADLRRSFDLIFSNPPYVEDREQLPSDVADWEPHLALFGGADGADHLRTIIAEAVDWLSPEGMLVLEMAPQQTTAMKTLAEQQGMRAEIREDLTGRPRSLCAWVSRRINRP